MSQIVHNAVPVGELRFSFWGNSIGSPGDPGNNGNRIRKAGWINPNRLVLCLLNVQMINPKAASMSISTRNGPKHPRHPRSPYLGHGRNPYP